MVEEALEKTGKTMEEMAPQKNSNKETSKSYWICSKTQSKEIAEAEEEEGMGS
jgi:hypothetical protein